MPIRNENGDVLQIGVAARRGTGPKARLRKFLDAFDAWLLYYQQHDGEDMTEQEMEQQHRLYNVMLDAREGVLRQPGLT